MILWKFLRSPTRAQGKNSGRDPNNRRNAGNGAAINQPIRAISETKLPTRAGGNFDQRNQIAETLHRKRVTIEPGFVAAEVRRAKKRTAPIYRLWEPYRRAYAVTRIDNPAHSARSVFPSQWIERTTRNRTAPSMVNTRFVVRDNPFPFFRRPRQ